MKCFFFVKPEILNCRPVTLEKRDRFAKDFFENAETLEHLFFSEHFQESMRSGVFNPIVGCRMKSYNTSLTSLTKVFGAAISKHLHESMCDGV